MDFEEHLRATEREAAAFTAAVRSGPLDAAVPSCPDWTVADLVVHVGNFTGFWTHVLCEATERPTTPFPPPPAPDGLADWYEALAGHLVETMATTPPDTKAWTWVREDDTARFAARRCANELAIHRLDAQLAREAPQPIDPALAADGIEEMFVMMTNRGAPPFGSGQSLHLHGTDTDTDAGAEWLVTLRPDEVEVRREHAKGDLALRAAVSDLELVLYQRPPIGPIEQFGDAAVLDAWFRAFTF